MSMKFLEESSNYNPTIVLSVFSGVVDMYEEMSFFTPILKNNFDTLLEFRLISL